MVLKSRNKIPLFYDSVSRTIIMIDEKNLNIFLRDYTTTIKKQTDWFSYLIAVITLTITLVTADFKDTYNIPFYYWKMLFILCDIFFMFLCCKAIYNSFKIRNVSPESLIQEIKDFDEEHKIQKPVIIDYK